MRSVGALALGLALGLLAFLSMPPMDARAQERAFLVVRDDGRIEDRPLRTGADVQAIAEAVLAAWETEVVALGASPTPPEVFSVWTSFPLGGSPFPTLYVPLGNDIRGIGLEHEYGEGARPDGTFDSALPPARCMLLHNDVTQLAERAAFQRAPVAGYGRYLFLLELSHLWGPALRVAGEAPDALIGFSFHWSFWMDAGGSPAGGSVLVELGDGRYRVERVDPAALRFSMLDLYVMGLASADEVPPFLLLEGATAESGTDPFSGRAIGPATFPWMGEEALVVTGTPREITIEEIVRVNGERLPAHGDAPTELVVDAILVVGADDTDAEVAAALEAFEPLAGGFPDAYADATRARGSLRLRSYPRPTVPTEPDAGVVLDGGELAPDAGPSSATPGSGCACSTSGAGRPPALLALGLAFVVIALRTRRGRAGAPAA